MSAATNSGPHGEQFSVKVVRAGFWQLSTVSTQAVLQLMVMGLLSRLLAPAEFGLVAVASVVTGFGAMLSDMGMAAAVVQRPSLSDGEIKLAFIMTVALGTFLAILIHLSSGIVEGFVDIQGCGVVLSVTAFGFMLTSFGGVSRALLQRKLSFKRLFLVDVLSYAIGYLGVGVPLAIYNQGVWSLVAASLVQSTVQSLLALKMQPIPWRAETMVASAKSMMSFGGGLTLTRILNYIGTSGDQIVVGRTLGPIALGTYERLMRILALPGTYLGNVLETVLFPAMARVQQEPKRVAEGFYLSLSVVWILMLPLSMLLFFLSGEIVHILLGSRWDDAIRPLQILFLTLPFRTSTRIMDSLVRAKGAVYRSAIRRVAFMAAVLLGVVLGSSQGLVGIALGVSLANLLLFALMVQLSFGIADLSMSQMLRAIAPGSLLGIVVLVTATAFDSLRSIMPSGAIPLSLCYSLVCGVAVALSIKCFPRIVGGHVYRLYTIVRSRYGFAQPDQ